MLENMAIYWGIGLAFFAAEYLWPARPLSYRKVFLYDVLALAVYQLFFFYAVQVTDRIPIPDYVNWRLHALPFVLRVIVFVLAADCGAYWMHRLWHTPWFWRIHKWHHSPTTLYWLAGVRASLPQVVMANLPFIIALPLLRPVPPAFFAFYGYAMILTNNWMHMNVSWESRWLEWVIVTPRYHRLHHSTDPAFSGRNLGVLFTIWDRLFGTYVNPEVADANVSYGIQESAHPVRLAIGI